MPKSLKIRAATSEDEISVVDLWCVCGLVTSYNDPAADFAFAKAGACSEVLVGERDSVIRASVMVGHDGHRGWLSRCLLTLIHAVPAMVDKSLRPERVGCAREASQKFS